MKIDDAFKEALKSKKRVPEWEEIIAKSPSHSVLYAKTVIGGRFFLAEETIAKNPYFVCAYLSELGLEKPPENIHRAMLSKGIQKNESLDDDKNYWLRQYFKICDYLDGKGPKPSCLLHGVNWNYGDAFLANF